MREPKPKDSKDGGPSYLESVRDILFGGQPEISDDDHFEVIRRSLDPKLKANHRALVYEYAQTHIQDPDRQAMALLFAAFKTIDGIEYRDRDNDELEDNKARFDESKSILEAVLAKADVLGVETIQMSYATLIKLEEALKERRTENNIYLYPAIFAKKGYQPSETELLARQELAAVAADYLDIIRAQSPEAQISLGGPNYTLYIDQVRFVGKAGEVSDSLIERAIELADKTHENAVSDMLGPVSATDNAAIKRAILDRALAITAASDRERPQLTRTEDQRFGRGIFKKIISVEVPYEDLSPFETRLNLLVGNMRQLRELERIVGFYPEHIRHVVSQHSPEEQAELWQRFARRIAGIAFTNGSYKIDEITSIMATVDRFGGIAPPEVADYARSTVRTRLAQATPEG